MVHTELGEQLRQAREAKGFSLDEVEKATGIRKRFLQAMEEGRFDALPGEIQLRGFLRNYASRLGLNGDDMLAVYERRTRPTQVTPQPTAAARAMPTRPTPQPPVKPPLAKAPLVKAPLAKAPSAQAQPAPAQTDQPARAAAPPPPPSSPTTSQATPAPRPNAPTIRPTPASAAQTRLASRLPSWLTLEMTLIAIAVVTALCIIILVVLLVTNPNSGAPAPTPRPSATRTRSVPPPPTVPPETPLVTLQPNVTSSVKLTTTADFVQIALVATEHVWVRVLTDGKTAFEGMFAPGQSLKWEAKDMLIVETGNGAGLNVSFNSKPIGALGPRSQIVARAWTPAGETSPPKPTPPPATPTATP